MSTVARIMICVPCKDRRAVVEQCLPTLVGSKYSQDTLRCYNDGSTEYDADWLTSLGADWAMNFSGLGIEAQRRMHLRDFWERRDDFTHLVFADSDSLWDISWREKMLELQEECGGRLTCGYNSPTHAGYAGNTYRETEDFVFRRFAPGVSYLLTHAHVEKIMPYVEHLTSFDWQIPGILGYKCAITKPSYTDHLGVGGEHDGVASVSAERAIAPTAWLKQKRQEILSNLGLKDA